MTKCANLIRKKKLKITKSIIKLNITQGFIFKSAKKKISLYMAKSKAFNLNKKRRRLADCSTSN